MAPTTPKHLQRPGLNFIPRCAGTSRHERLVRKHVPDYDPGCPLQSTSMPALHRRNVPNCRPAADGGMRKCSAGACPPQGSGWGVAESAVLIRCTKPQLRLFIPRCAGTSRHERLVTKACPGLRSGVNSGAGRRHQPPSPEQRQPRVAREKCSAGACPQLRVPGQPAQNIDRRPAVHLIRM